MALLNAATMIVSDAETLQLIEEFESDFYGADEQSCDRSFRRSTPEDDDEYLSPTEYDADTRRSIEKVGQNDAQGQSVCDDEVAVIASEFESGCGCKEQCYKQFGVEEICEFRLSLKELDKHERDLFLMGKLQTLIKDPSTVTHARSSKAVLKKQRLRVMYAFDHRIVCQHAFCFIHDIGDFTLRSLKKHISEAGPCPREHGSKGRKPHNAYPFDVIQNAVEFVKNYAHVFGLPQPAAPRGRANQAPTYLPASQNHKIIHAKYPSACMQDEKSFMQYRSFLDVWHQCIPHIVFMTPRTDVCHYCEDYRIAIQGAVTDSDKTTLVAEFGEHLEEAQKERDAYLAAIEKAKKASTTSREPNFSHFTFDFAQQVFIPYHSRQVGPLYYKVPLHVQIFGICNDAIPLQVNYLFHEGQTIGKNGAKSHGPNSVISMLHHYLAVHGKQKSECHFHADNCVGQNKNKSVLAYFMWRTLVGLNKEITLSFMRVGHTRCMVDACFGLLKQRYRSSECDTMEHLQGIVQASAKCNSTQLFEWEWREWDKFLSEKFKPLPGI